MSQQNVNIPETVGQHSPVRPMAAHLGLSAQADLPGVGARCVGAGAVGGEAVGEWVSQQKAMTPADVGQQLPTRPMAAHLELATQEAELSTGVGWPTAGVGKTIGGVGVFGGVGPLTGGVGSPTGGVG